MIECIYLALGTGLAIIAGLGFDSLLAAILVAAGDVVVVSVIWLVYMAVVWVFKREAAQSVLLGPEGIMEVAGARERSFIPWTGVARIELNGTVIAGSTVRIRGSFSEITLSNLDLTVNRPMSLRELGRAFGQSGSMRELVDELRLKCPRAAFKMNRLARRRFKNSAPAGNG